LSFGNGYATAAVDNDSSGSQTPLILQMNTFCKSDKDTLAKSRNQKPLLHVSKTTDALSQEASQYDKELLKGTNF